MNKKLIFVIVLFALILGAAAYLFYGKTNYLDILNDKTKSLAERAEAAEKLIELNDPKAFDSFAKIAVDKSENIILRIICSRGAVYTDTEKALPILLQVIKDPNDDNNIKAAAILAFGHAGYKKALQPLSEIFASSNDSSVRFKIMQAFGNINNSGSYILAGLNDSDDFVRAVAIQSLAKTKDLSYVPIIGDILESSEEFIQIQCIGALGYLCGEESIEILRNFKERTSSELLKSNIENALNSCLAG